MPQVGRLLGAPRTVEYWVRRTEQKGLTGLTEGERPGRPTRLSAAQIQEVSRVLRGKPSDGGMRVNLRFSLPHVGTAVNQGSHPLPPSPDPAQRGILWRCAAERDGKFFYIRHAWRFYGQSFWEFRKLLSEVEGRTPNTTTSCCTCPGGSNLLRTSESTSFHPIVANSIPSSGSGN